jgi:hypothetical protein
MPMPKETKKESDITSQLIGSGLQKISKDALMKKLILRHNIRFVQMALLPADCQISGRILMADGALNTVLPKKNLTK